MSTLDFHFRRLFEMPEVWRDLDRAVARWVMAHGGSKTMALAGGWASYADGQGDSALVFEPQQMQRLGLNDWEALQHALQDCLEAGESAWMGVPCAETPKPKTPFVMEHGAFYMRRSFLDEVAVAEALNARLQAAEVSASSVSQAEVDSLFPDSASAEEAPQREAVIKALGQRFFVLTGGPGTGKTTTVLRLLMAQVRDFSRRHERLPELVMAAPTGKAAQRLAESLRVGVQYLKEETKALWQSEWQCVLAKEPGTLHRLLGSRGPSGGFSYGADNRLPADIVLVDESSMVDLSLLRALLSALSPETMLVLLGDADQLAPVGTGTALADLVGALEGGRALTRLHHSFRSNRELVALNEAVRAGDSAAFSQAIETSNQKAQWHEIPDSRSLAKQVAQWAERVHHVLAQAQVFESLTLEDTAQQSRALAATKSLQLLCALREGPFGVQEVNAAIEAFLRRTTGAAHETNWYPGRCIIITRNHYATGLFNGDIGLCLRVRDSQGEEYLKVFFEATGDEGPRHFDTEYLPEHETAFALTVHKSQGSEYGEVAVVLPPDDTQALLSRQLLHTGVSRAKERVQLWAMKSAVIRCLDSPLARGGRLKARLT